MPTRMARSKKMVLDNWDDPEAEYSALDCGVLEEVMNALSATPNAEQLAVPLLADLKALGVHVEQTVYKRAVETSVRRAGRNNAHPERGAFQTVSRGRGKGA